MAKFRQLSIFILLVIIMASIYMLTFRGRIESGDTLRAMDALTSKARFDDWLMDESVWFKYFYNIREFQDLPLAEYDVEERLNLYLAMPLLRLAEIIPQMGNIHTVWLFNVLITSLNVGFVYLLVRLMDYDDRVAILVALSSGIATNMWAYSQTFFREPLVSFFILLLLIILQTVQKRVWLIKLVGVIGAVILFILAYQAKFSAVMFLPALFFFAIPALFTLQLPEHLKKLSATLLVVQVLLLIALIVFEPLTNSLNPLIERFTNAPEYVAHALRMYIRSPGGSLWGTSPVLLMCIVGCLLWLRDRTRHHFVWMIWFIFIGYTLGHAILTGSNWFGGQSWPPRFLVPIIPILMIASAPVFARILDQRDKLFFGIWIILLIYGLWIQFTSVSLMWYHYEGMLPLEANNLTEWTYGLTDVQYFRWVLLPQRWDDLGIDFLWIRTQTPAWAISYGIIAGIAGTLLIYCLRSAKHQFLLILSIILAGSGLLVTLVNVRSVYFKDPVIQSHKSALFDVVNYLSANSGADDILILPNNTYERFILNHLDSDHPRPIILQPELTEPASEKQPAELMTSNPAKWLPMTSLRAVHHVANNHERFWLLANTSPFMTWSFRPFERYLAQFYYPIQEIQLDHPDETVRLLEYSTVHPAPNPFSTFGAEQLTDLQYGESIRLEGFTIPGGTLYNRGEVVDLSLLWSSDTTIPLDYTVAWFIADAESGAVLVQGQDSMPQAGFAPTSLWSAHQRVWDNRAVRIPEDSMSGEYVIWVLLYRFNLQTNQIERLPVSGSDVTDDRTVGVLPIRLSIMS